MPLDKIKNYNNFANDDANLKYFRVLAAIYVPKNINSTDKIIVADRLKTIVNLEESQNSLSKINLGPAYALVGNDLNKLILSLKSAAGKYK